MSIRISIIFLALVTFTNTLNAEVDWYSFTLDNDIFVGNDNAYTNGVYLSLYDTPDPYPAITADDNPDPGILVRPLLWSMPQRSNPVSVNSYTIGQAMMTPQDITQEVPPEDDFPYAGLLYLNGSYFEVEGDTADMVSATIGLVGPISGAEHAQILVHRVVGADHPEGWDTQLDNELAFQIGRGRVWRLWRQGSQMDVMLGLEGFLGTIESSISSEMTFRVGSLAEHSFATALLNKSRISNPLAIGSDWYAYFAFNASYTFNAIFLDGNTFQESRSLEYDPARIGASLGFTYAFDDAIISISVVEMGLLTDAGDKPLRELTRFGALTYAWRF